MAEKKVTKMVIKVDLGCEKCHKKIKKVLCRIPQIQDQIYDKKAGTVTITVLCCSPEKIKEKIICEGGEAVKSIEIKVPEKPKAAPKKPEEPRKQPDLTQGADDGNGNDNPKGPRKPKNLIVKPSKQNEPEMLKVVNVEPVDPRTCCPECYRGISGGPCYRDYGRPAPPSYEIYGRPVHDSWGGSGGGYHAFRCEYVCEDNPSSCTIM
ncbi:PREDICTED: uncharacterized protein LOC105111002 [Populus euphratica]|uniref:Uncharacterized protein LOC105111002 n=1 Tax=Populus euphratica TaxID=75702 RepID=A0AAJ6T587_POPEU|nr:PREDICTED: uncharacterized protein LOC105111002 [Populus euphratica]